ncbi:glycosyl transferase family protein [Brucella sp. BE17]|uniref:glycosyl transferase family protein n=1 Tax=Brucella sp. BE17 TaxID=3142977 RepID=UPI0031BA8A04
MSLYWPYLFADYYQWLEYAAITVSIIILISSIDDLFIDVWYWVREIYRTFTIKRRYQPLRPEQLRNRPEQHIAIMVPAWLEYDVIAPMLENMVQTLDYRSYTIFAGTYRNDAATIKEVERMRRRYRQLVRVEVPHDGPTCKADCLNWVVQAIFAHEQKHGIEFAGVVLHDSEDVLHPLELQFYNYLLPRKDLIQIPVGSLERNWYELVAGVYMDEFAEWHAKDLVVRESLAKTVTSAGVGTCFSRRALLTLASETDNQPFNTQTLTEDYDIGVRLSAHGMHSILARFPVEYRVMRKSWFGYGRTREKTLSMPLSVREYFPNTFRTSYRQKARWSLGICFQGWAYFGWRGSMVDRYFLMRDRKGMVTAFIAILAYFLAVQYIIFQVAFVTGLLSIQYPPLLALQGWVGVVLGLNAIALILRLVQRVYFTGRMFGWEHGLLSVPRMMVGNMVNFMAMSRAWKQYIVHRITGRPLVWDKTMHDFPTSEGLVGTGERLGDLLMSWQAIDENQLNSALDKQKNKNTPLGRILVQEGWLAEEVLAEAVAFQAGLEMTSVSEAEILAGKAFLPADLSIRLRTLALAPDEAGKVGLVVSVPLSPEGVSQVTAVLGYKPQQFIVRDRDINAGLRILRGNGSDKIDAGVPLLGAMLVDEGILTQSALEAAMHDYSPSRDGLVGAYLVARNVISQNALDQALTVQSRLSKGMMPS